jgi:hypothetical protein
MEAYSKSLEDIETIDMILNEANAYNLRAEVEESAHKLIAEGMTDVNAYECAFMDWIK